LEKVGKNFVYRNCSIFIESGREASTRSQEVSRICKDERILVKPEERTSPAKDDFIMRDEISAFAQGLFALSEEPTCPYG
jgi:hypothetical protein